MLIVILILLLGLLGPIGGYFLGKKLIDDGGKK
jgi:uncharacterized protein YneF (UPF0154 family)